MLFLKLLFWSVLIMLLLPSSRQDKQDLYGAAERTVYDVTSFCSRNPDVCEKARLAFATMIQKIELGAEIVMDLISAPPEENSKLRQGANLAVDAPHPGARMQSGAIAGEPVRISRYTLTADDLKPDWQNPAEGP